MVRIVQLTDGAVRRVGLVDEPDVRLLQGADSVYALVASAIASGTPLSALVARAATGETLDYDEIHAGASGGPSSGHSGEGSAGATAGRARWRLLPPIDHPEEPARCLVSGTGLTHVGSANDRHAMHDQADETPTDSIRMFQAGLAGGRPESGRVGVAPEWFYKGPGTILRAHGEPLVVPPYAEGGGEEAEIAGVYIVDPAGSPRRVGMAVGNEFSDHRFEKHNYLYLAGSKLRPCALGPELVLDPAFDTIPGEVSIARGDTVIWQKRIASGEAEMSHSLQNIEHHHFKFAAHRRPGDVHVHYFGAPSLSFGEGVSLEDGDVMTIRFEGFGRPLRNAVLVEQADDRLVEVHSLG
jgi:hypothetical protein